MMTTTRRQVEPKVKVVDDVEEADIVVFVPECTQL